MVRKLRSTPLFAVDVPARSLSFATWRSSLRFLLMSSATIAFS
jgi:hypothetical protein